MQQTRGWYLLIVIENEEFSIAFLLQLKNSPKCTVYVNRLNWVLGASIHQLVGGRDDTKSRRSSKPKVGPGGGEEEGRAIIVEKWPFQRRQHFINGRPRLVLPGVDSLLKVIVPGWESWGLIRPPFRAHARVHLRPSCRLPAPPAAFLPF